MTKKVFLQMVKSSLEKIREEEDGKVVNVGYHLFMNRTHFIDYLIISNASVIMRYTFQADSKYDDTLHVTTRFLTGDTLYTSTYDGEHFSNYRYKEK